MNKWSLSLLGSMFMLIAGWLLVQPASATPTTDIPGGNISTDTTWTAADSPYDVLGAVTIINGATLTVEAGVELNFDGTAFALTVSDGSLIANGTLTNTIVFGSSGMTAGDWRGIDVAAGGSAEMSHCDIAYAGSNNALGSVRLNSSANSITDCTIRDGNGPGIVINGAGLTPTIASVSISGHASEAIRQSALAMQPIYSNLTISDNAINGITIPGGSLAGQLSLTPAGIITDSTRAAGDVIPYRFSNVVTIVDNAALTVTGKADIRFNNTAHYFDVRNGGHLALAGTMTNPVTLQSDSGAAGSWYGILARGGSQVTMSHCELIGAGSSANGSLYLETSDAVVENCAIRNGASHGVVLSGAGLTPTLRSVAIISNTGTAVRQSTVDMTPTYRDLVVSSNGIDAIDAGSGALTRDLTLVPVGVISDSARADDVIPYRFRSTITIADSAALSVTGRADIRFNNSGHYIDVRDGGQLTLAGTITNPVTLQSDSGTAGSWYGIFARSGAQVTMSHCELIGAGSTANGSLYLRASDAVVEDCVIRNGASHGVVLAGVGLTPTLRSVAIISNTGTAVYQSTVDMSPSYQNLIVSDNGIDAIDAGSGTVSRQLTFVPAGVISDSARAVDDVIPYRFRGSVTILANAALSVTGEADLRFNSSNHLLDVRSGGQLTLAGTLTDSITIQSDSGVAASWYGIYARGGSHIALTHCELVGAGSTASGSLYLETSDAIVEECIVRDGGNHGAVLSGAGLTPTLRNVAIISNTGTAVRQSTVDMNPTYDGLIVSGNGIDAIDAGSGTINRNITLVPAGVVMSPAHSGANVVIPYRFAGTVTVLNGNTLSVTENADLRFNNSTHFLDVRSGAALRLLGGPAPVRIGSDAQTAGSWYGVYIRAGASATLDRCEIGYGGSTSNGGLFIGASDVTVSSCRIHDNANAGIVVNSAQPTLDCNSIENNAAGLINQTTGVEVDATNNWWGDASGPFNATSNASGMGDSVSDGVLFDPWKAAPTAVGMLDVGVSAEIPPTTLYASFLTVALLSVGLLGGRVRKLCFFQAR